MGLRLEEMVRTPKREDLVIDVDSFLELVKRIGQFELEGRGSEIISRHDVVKNYISAPDSSDAFSIDSDRDRALHSLGSEKRAQIMRAAIAGLLGEKITAIELAGADQQIYFTEAYVESMPHIRNFLDKNPELLRHKDFLMNGLYTLCTDLYQKLLCENLLEISGFDAERNIVPTFAYARRLLARKSDADEHGLLAPLAAIMPEDIRQKYKQASSPMKWVLKSAKKKHPAPDKHDIAGYALTSHLFIDEPRSLSAVVQIVDLIHQYIGRDSDANIVLDAIEDVAERRGLSHVLERIESRPDASLDLLKTSIESAPDEKSEQWHDLFCALSSAANLYDSLVISPLTRRKNDGLAAGMLHKSNGENCTTLERRLHNELGTIWRIVYEGEDKAQQLFMKLGGEQIAGFMTYVPEDKRISVEQLLTRHEKTDVRTDPLAFMIEKSYILMLLIGGKELKDRMGDNRPKYSTIDFFKDIYQYFKERRLFAVIKDALIEDKIPDHAPPDVTIVEYPEVVSTLGWIGLHNLHSEKIITKALQPIAVYSLNRDEDNVLTLATIGVLNARRKNYLQAVRYLGMAANWAKDGVEKFNVPAAGWRSFSLYERSLIASTDNERVDLLAQALDAAPIDAMSEIPVFTPEKGLSYHALVNPMNFKLRVMYASSPSLRPEVRESILSRARHEMNLLRANASGEKKEYLDLLVSQNLFSVEPTNTEQSSTSTYRDSDIVYTFVRK